MNDAKKTQALTAYPASDAIELKIESTHGIQWHEVEEVFDSNPRFELIVASDQYGEPRYAALGQTAAGRYVYIVFVPNDRTAAKVITARDMTSAERRRYKRS